MTKAEMDQVIEIVETTIDRLATGDVDSEWAVTDVIEKMYPDWPRCQQADVADSIIRVERIRDDLKRCSSPESRIESLLKTAAALRKERER